MLLLKERLAFEIECAVDDMNTMHLVKKYSFRNGCFKIRMSLLWS